MQLKKIKNFFITLITGIDTDKERRAHMKELCAANKPQIEEIRKSIKASQQRIANYSKNI